MSKKFVRFTHQLGFNGVEFQSMLSRNACLLTYKDFDPVITKEQLGRSAKHEQNLFVFLLGKDKAIRVNTQKKRIWLGNGKPLVKKFLESIA